MRALSRASREPTRTCFDVDGDELTRATTSPAESRLGLFGGNSNWRGPIWFPVNYLLIESLQKFHHYYGDDFTVECPTGSGRLRDARRGRRRAVAPPGRASSCATPTAGGRSSAHMPQLQTDPHFRDHLLFYEYFHGDNGRGVGASPPDRLDRAGRQADPPARGAALNGNRSKP